MRRRDGLMRLGISKRIYAREVIGNLLRRRRLEKNVGILSTRERRREGVCGLAESFGGDNGRGERRGFVQVLEQRPAERYDGVGRVDGDSREQREVLAAVGICAKVVYGCVCEQDQRERGNLPEQMVS